MLIINKLQKKKRRSPLDDNDIEWLNQIDDSNIQAAFGKYVLLEDKEKASIFFEQFTSPYKEHYKGMPIYKLYSELIT